MLSDTQCISHLRFQVLRAALTANDSIEGGLDCHFDSLGISIPSQKPESLPVKLPSVTQKGPFQDV